MKVLYSCLQNLQKLLRKQQLLNEALLETVLRSQEPEEKKEVAYFC
jgi:hypothetical protein